MAESVSTDIQRIEEAIRKRVSIGSQLPIAKLIEEMQARFSETSVAFALRNLVLNG